MKFKRKKIIILLVDIITTTDEEKNKFACRIKKEVEVKNNINVKDLKVGNARTWSEEERTSKKKMI